MNNVAIAIEKTEYTKLVLEVDPDQNAKKATLFVSGRMVLLPNNKLKFGIQMKQQGKINALVELYGHFDTKDFDPDLPDDVAVARSMGFGYLFPFARSAFSSLFTVGGYGVQNLPFILVDDVFGNVSLEKELD